MSPEQKNEIAEYLTELEALLRQAASPNRTELTEHDFYTGVEKVQKITQLLPA